MQGIGSEAELAHVLIVSLLLSSARMLGFLSIVPFIGQLLPSGLVRTGVVMALCLLLVPEVATQYQTMDLSWAHVSLLLVKEGFLGLLFAVVLGALASGISAAGYFLDFQRGANSSDAYSPLSQESTSYTSIFLLHAYVAILFVSGGFLYVIELMYKSYTLWPILDYYPRLSPRLPDIILGVLDTITSIMLLLFVPAVIVMFLSEVALALYSRYSPQINVTIMSMPIKSGLLFLVIVLMMPVTFEWFKNSIFLYDDYFLLLIEILQ